MSYFTYLEPHTALLPKLALCFIILVNILPKLELSMNFDFFIFPGSKFYLVPGLFNSFYEIFVLHAPPFPFFTTMIPSTSHLDHWKHLLTGLFFSRLFYLQISACSCTTIPKGAFVMGMIPSPPKWKHSLILGKIMYFLFLCLSPSIVPT